MKQRLHLTLLAAMLALMTWANGEEIDGIYYLLDSDAKTASVTYTGSNFNNNAYTGSITIPKSITYNDITYSVTSIGIRAFYGCEGLTSITIPNSVTNIGGYAFDNCDSLKNVTISNSVTSIGDAAFRNCTGLVSIIILNSVTTIRNTAFGLCTGLTSINIPNSVTDIAENAFYACTGLNTVSVVRRDPSAYNCDNDAFNKLTLSSLTLKVPVGCKEAYAATSPWSSFGNIVEDESLTAIDDVPTIDNSSVSVAYYDLQGKRITQPKRGQLVIVRYSDGKTRKMMVK